jgi:L-methionine (R)-S-oxide reductase
MLFNPATRSHNIDKIGFVAAPLIPYTPAWHCRLAPGRDPDSGAPMSHVVTAIHAASKPEFYTALHRQLAEVLRGENDWICTLAQTSAFLMQSLPDLNWAGFYLLKGETLVLGPFQGKVACTRIPLGRGVCGTAAAQRKTIVVPNVHEFPGHIACDSASNAEIVVPLVQRGRVLGVLDLDSPRLHRFDADDARGLEAVIELLLECSEPVC